MGQVKIWILVVFPILMYSQEQNEVDTIRVFYLGGQSNMDGLGYNSDLPKSLQSGYENVWIFHGNPVADEQENGGEGVWEKLKPGHGKDFSYYKGQNNLSNRFGPELSFAKKIRELYPNEKIALIKYSRRGTSIDSLGARDFGSWEPDFNGKTGINQYDHFLKTISNAMSTKDIDKDGNIDVLIPSGILWMQGESDALEEQIAFRYYDNLKRLIDLFRAALRVDDLPVVIGKISDSGRKNDGKVWKFGELVQYAQEKFARIDKNALIVRDTKYYKYSDPYHYDSAGYIDLGEKFAESIYLLNKK